MGALLTVRHGWKDRQCGGLEVLCAGCKVVRVPPILLFTMKPREDLFYTAPVAWRWRYKSIKPLSFF